MFLSDLVIGSSSRKVGSYIELAVLPILYYLLQGQALAIPRTMFPGRMEQTVPLVLSCVFFPAGLLKQNYAFNTS